ncbi:GH92 family glycosyl hydrolase [Flavitalea flava]
MKIDLYHSVCLITRHHLFVVSFFFAALHSPGRIIAQNDHTLHTVLHDHLTNHVAIGKHSRENQAASPADEVDPLIGTDKSSHRTVWESNGATFPGVLLPFGMVQITPDSYHYKDTHIGGFSFLNHHSGWSSGGNFLIMPFTGPEKKSSSFLHSREQSHPWQYDVDLPDFDIHSSFTATVHAGFGRFVFPASGQSHILISDVSEVKIISDSILTGQSHGIWFIAHTSKPFHIQHSGKEGDSSDSNSSESNSSEIRLDFTTRAGEIIDLRIGFSLTSIAGAAKNLLVEIPDHDFEKISRENKQIWNRRLRSIEIKGGDAQRRRVFYTALYHSSFMPAILSDAGEIPRRYSPTYPWDTYRSEHPLIALLDPLAEGEMIASTLDTYDQTGWLPTGNMLGNHNVELILDAYNKGIRNFDVVKARQAIRKSLLDSPYARRDMSSYNRLGYVPAYVVNSVSQTLEFSYNDWAGANFLKTAGETPEEDIDVETLLRRSYNYRHLYDAASGFMRARNVDGSQASGGYCEGTEWTYSWYVPHDVNGLVNLMGGKEAFSKKLSECMEKGYYVHDNEPPFHYAYLFDFVNQPWKTQQWVRHICEASYSADPGGLPGNDDLGALSSWFVLSAMGIYPVTPGRPVYEIGSPLFNECVVHLPNGKDFRIQAPSNSSANKYIQYATLNGQPYLRPWLSHMDILAGGTLVLHMGPEPNKKWGAAVEDAPPSQTTGHPDFTVSPPLLSSPTAEAGEVVEWSCKVSNTGLAAGSRHLAIFVDGKYYADAKVLVNAQDTQHVILPIVLYYAGSHVITIGKEKSPRKLFVKAKEPAFVYRDLSVPLPSVFYRKDCFTVSAKIKNTGSRKARTSAILYLNHKPFRTKTTTLEPGQEKEVSFPISGNDCTPVSEIAIGDLSPSTVRILEPGMLPSADTTLLHRLGAVMVLNFDQGPAQQVTDISGEGNNGKVHGKVKWVEGLFGKAIQTNAMQGSYIEIPSGKELDSLGHNETMTMMAWIYPMEEENFSDILCKGDWNSLQLKGSNTFINFYSNGWEGHEAFSPVPSGWNRHWHHIAGVTRQAFEELYIDGRLVGVKKMEPRDPKGETGAGDYSGSHLWNIGRNGSDPTRVFKGYIDDVMLFRKALTVEEINKVMMHAPY